MTDATDTYIIKIDDEHMQVINISVSTMTVERNSTPPTTHGAGSAVYIKPKKGTDQCQK